MTVRLADVFLSLVQSVWIAANIAIVPLYIGNIAKYMGLKSIEPALEAGFPFVLIAGAVAGAAFFLAALSDLRNPKVSRTQLLPGNATTTWMAPWLLAMAFLFVALGFISMAIGKVLSYLIPEVLAVSVSSAFVIGWATKALVEAKRRPFQMPKPKEKPPADDPDPFDD